jgi:hypothetical protein
MPQILPYRVFLFRIFLHIFPVGLVCIFRINKL